MVFIEAICVLVNIVNLDPADFMNDIGIRQWRGVASNR